MYPLIIIIKPDMFNMITKIINTFNNPQSVLPAPVNNNINSKNQ